MESTTNPMVAWLSDILSRSLAGGWNRIEVHGTATGEFHQYVVNLYKDKEPVSVSAELVDSLEGSYGQVLGGRGLEQLYYQ